MLPPAEWTSTDWSVAVVWAILGLILLNDILPAFWFRKTLRFLFPAPAPKRRRSTRRKR